MKLLSRLRGQKKILGILLSMALAVGILVPATAVFASSPANVYVSPPTQTVSPGATVTVSVNITSTVAINGFEFDVTFNPSILTFKSVTEGSFLTSGGGSVAGLESDTSAASSGTVAAIADSLKSGGTVPAGSGTLATLTFTGNATGVTSIGLANLLLTNASAQSIPGGTLTGGAVAVGTPPAPTISSFTPTIGGIGTSVTITGTHFTGTTGVSFSGTAAQSFAFVSDSQITAVVPSLGSSEVSVPISVTTFNGNETATSSSDFTFVPAPTISSFTPTTALPGGSVVIAGTNLSTATAVSFGGVAASSFTVNSNTQITAVVGSGASGSVSVTTPGGTASLAGFYMTPAISSFSPTTGDIGTSVVITGTNLTGATAVSFGNTPAQSYTVNSNTQITAVVGSGASGNVTVTAPGGTASMAGFTFIPAGIVSFTPTTGYTGDTITINGAGFYGGGSSSAVTAVKIGGVAAQSYQVLSDTVITAVVANGATGKITVTIPAGTLTSSGTFTYKQVAVQVAPVTQTLATNGASFSVNLNINTNGSKQIRGWQTNINFDPTRIQCASVAEGSFLNSFALANGANTTFGTVTIDNTHGTITGLDDAILGASEAGGATGSGTLATLNFHAIGNVTGTAYITPVNVILADVNGNSIPNLVVAGGYVTLAGNSTSQTPSNVSVSGSLIGQLTFIAPDPVSGWNLVVSNSNTALRTMDVFANTDWQVTVQDMNYVTGGYMTEDNGTAYFTNVKLSNPLNIGAAPGSGGAGNAVNLNIGGIIATGIPSGQNPSTGGDMRTVTFTQPVTYTDPTLSFPYFYLVVVTFTASSSSY